MFYLSPKSLGLILTLFAATGFALKTILAKLAYSYGIDPLTLLTLRMGVAGTAFSSVLAYNLVAKRWNLRLSQKRWLLICWLSLFGYYLSSFLDFSGLVYVDANLGRMILFLYPTIVVILNSIIRREKIALHIWLALILCYAGIALMLIPSFSHSSNNIIKGSLLIFSGALTYSVYLVAVDRYFKTTDIIMYITLVMIISSLCVFTHFFISHDITTLSVPFPVYLLALIMGLFSTVLPGYAISAGIALIGASKAATVSMSGPVLTLVMSYLILGESISLIQFVGMVLVILGVAKVK
ncbi:MAG: DMT family transporter [Deltaproteobacteria bacterium]|jgi:drug/metabolite transporter (DMT)-like permease|nr:DMT family transporter [Deltaproteobacteria bacterium]